MNDKDLKKLKDEISEIRSMVNSHAQAIIDLSNLIISGAYDPDDDSDDSATMKIEDLPFPWYGYQMYREAFA